VSRRCTCRRTRPGPRPGPRRDGDRLDGRQGHRRQGLADQARLHRQHQARDRRAGLDRATLNSPLTVANAAGNGAKATQVKVTVRGDLAVDLIAPDGTQYKLKSSTSGDNVANLDKVFTVDLSGKARNGVWKLRVTDVFAGDTGTWTLTV
jgi:subtilisin-like proprotein convertase family protein